MERKVTQEEFDSLVLETIEEFELPGDEAVEFAVTQLEAQGVNCSMLVKDMNVIKKTDALTEFKRRYIQLLELDDHDERLHVVDVFVSNMQAAVTIAKKSPAHHLYAGSLNIHLIALKVAKSNQHKFHILEACLHSLLEMFSGFPDLMTESTIDWLIELYNSHCSHSPNDCAIRRLSSKLLLEGIKAHEANKQLLISKDIINIIRENLQTNNDEEMETALLMIIHLCTDDDIRTEISGAHNHAVSLAPEFLIDCSKYLSVTQGKEVTVQLLRAVISMLVTSDLCLEVFQMDQEFKTFEALMVDWQSDPIIVMWSLKWLTALSGNDDARSAMTPLIPRLISVIDANLGSEKIIDAGCLMLASLALRNNENALTMMEHGAIDKICQCIKIHRLPKFRKHACMALRNMASSSKQPQPFYDAGVPEMLADVMVESTTVKDECKAVLVAIGAPVVLNEIWTGERGDIIKGN